jgi:hypothetical protein
MKGKRKKYMLSFWRKKESRWPGVLTTSEEITWW